MQHVIATFRSDGVHFGFADEALRFPLPTDRPAPSQTAALEQLWVEEQLVEDGEGYVLPTPAIYLLEPDTARVLGLPVVDSPAAIELRSSSYVGRPDFAITALLSFPKHGLVLPRARTGCFVELQGEWLRLPKEQLRLLELLERPMPSSLDEQWVFTGQVKDAAVAARADMDRFLADQEVFVASNVAAEVEAAAADRIILGPIYSGVPEDAFEAARRRDAPTRNVYFEAQGTRRRRLVIPDEQRQQAEQLKGIEIAGPDVPRFLDNPDAFLPEGVDLSEFSPRVKGLIPTRYNSRPYIHVTPTRARDWFEVSFHVGLAQPDELGDAAAGEPPSAPEQAMAAEDGDVARMPKHTEDAVSSLEPEAYAELCRRVVATGERWQLQDGVWVDIDPDQAAGFLNAWDSRQQVAAGVTVVQRGYILDVISNLDELEFSAAEESGPAGVDLPEYELPARLAATLLPHQAYGYRWLSYLHDQGLGGLLADDMGLGKTVQVIACMARLAEANKLRPALVVAPVALVDNWLRELRRFAPEIRRCHVHQGASRHRDAALLESYDVVLTTYQTLRRDQLMLGRIDWTMIVCDEAQNVKNPTAQMTAATKGMKARLRVAVTGTPVENGLSELWCIVDFAQPGKLGSQREFRHTFEQPLIESSDSAETSSLVDALQDRLTPHYVRRLKGDVLNTLPERQDYHYHVDLGPRQQQIYARVAGAVRDGSMIPLEGIQKLIAICSHPELAEPSNASTADLISECPKLQQTLALLHPIKQAGERVVVFTRLRAMQRIIQDAIRTEFGIHAAIINGEVPGARRVEMVDQFNSYGTFGVLILGPEAGGVGLNIVGANHVIHYTRLWNPAKENQATDRVHRLGQTRPVTVHYPIVADTVEEKLDQLLEEKRALAENVLVPRESLSVMNELVDSLGGRVA